MRSTRRSVSLMLAAFCATLPTFAQTQSPGRPGAESNEALRVAAWVRNLEPALPETAHFAVIGGLSMVHIGGGATQFVRSSGPAALYENLPLLAQARQALEMRASTYASSLAEGGITWFRDVQNFPWGLIEPARGDMDFELSDAAVQSLETVGARYVGTVMPYAGWELKEAGYLPTEDDMCMRLLSEDFYYLAFDGRMDRFRDSPAWLDFLEAIVERYDGDGVGDMHGLVHGVEYWQVHNEPEGDRCGGFRDDIGAFVDLMRASWTVVHESCPACKVLQGGAGIPLWRENEVGGGTFWRDFAAMGGAQWVDVIAVHYNHGKVDGGSIDNFETQVHRMRELLGEDKPVWVTEFGVFVDFGGQFQALSEHDAAAWYVRFYAAGLAAGVDRFFSDAPSFFRYPDGTVLLPFYVNKLLESKIGSFTSAAKIADGQYRFTVDGESLYVVWEGVPDEIHGRVSAIDLYGNETVADATELTPTESSPLILSRRTRRKHTVRR